MSEQLALMPIVDTTNRERERLCARKLLSGNGFPYGENNINAVSPQLGREAYKEAREAVEREENLSATEVYLKRIADSALLSVPPTSGAPVFKPGDHVRYCVSYSGSPVVGAVTSTEDVSGLDYRRTIVWVRWCGPDGQPSGESASYAPGELVHA